MALKGICQVSCLASLLFFQTCYAQGFPYPGQTLQIHTHFHSIIGKPTWLLILRDPESQRVLPYLFEPRENDNFWVAFSTAHAYIVTVSKMKWGPFAVINNFCGLENGVITNKSFFITLTGNLSPNVNSFHCGVLKYNDTPFTIVGSQ